MSPTPADPPEHSDAGREPRRDLAAGALAAGLAICLTAVHVRQGGRLHDDYGAEPGPALLPELLLGALALIGAALLVRGFWTRRAVGLARRDPNEPGGDKASRASLVVFVLLAAAMFLQSAVGLGLATALLGVLLTIILARQERRSLPRAAVEGVLVAGTLYALFRFVLSVPLT